MKLTFTLIVLCSYCLLNAQKGGTLDKSFGNNGIVITDFDTAKDEARALLILKNNGILVAGNTLYELPLRGRVGFGLVKYKEDGTPDSSFGRNGKVVSYFYHDAQTRCIALQPDGKILVGGSMASDIPNTNDYFVLIRYKKNGRLDSSFGDNGHVATLLPHNEGGSFYSILLQPDGKIIGVGTSFIINQNYAAIRYLSNGKLDSTFGINGAISTDVFWDYAYKGALQPDGKIVIGGSTEDPLGEKAMLIRYTANGYPDSSFGINGKQIEDFGLHGYIQMKSMQLLTNGKLLLAGDYYSTNGKDSVILARFNNNGSPDITFAPNGVRLNSFRFSSQTRAMTLQPDGKIILAGEALGKVISYGVARYEANGEVDSSFGDFGAIQTTFPYISFANAVAVQPDGKIVLAGGVSECLYCEDFGIARYNAGLYAKTAHAQVNDVENIKTTGKLVLYPNPAQNILRVEGLSSMQNLPTGRQAKLTVVDFNGNIKLQAVANASSYNLNIASLHAGNYLLKIEVNGDVVTKQFVRE